MITWQTFGLVVGPVISTWLSYRLDCAWLAIRGRLPWLLMGFLTDAHQRGVLRQAGAVYQFRHIELQHRLAARPSASTGVAVKEKTEEATESPAEAAVSGEESTEGEAS